MAQATIVNEQGRSDTVTGTAQTNETSWRKAISPQRDRLQSRILVGVMLPVLIAAFLLVLPTLHGHPGRAREFLIAFGVSWTFGMAVWALRSATALAAFSGSLICFLVTLFTKRGDSVFVSGLAPMLALFVLTYLATKAGRRRKASLGLAEGKKGRNAAQVIANLGASALATIAVTALDAVLFPNGRGTDGINLTGVLNIVLVAVFAEATADTVSSEVGQAFGGTPFLVTTLRRVPPGTDGAISLRGTAAGIAAAAVVSILGTWALGLMPEQALIAFLAGIAGLFFDSLLGATIERKGWLGNDLVNFTSTLFAAAMALVALALL
jgi:uncharacterized protein (TIGR00297 family)